MELATMKAKELIKNGVNITHFLFVYGDCKHHNAIINKMVTSTPVTINQHRLHVKWIQLEQTKESIVFYTESKFLSDKGVKLFTNRIMGGLTYTSYVMLKPLSTPVAIESGGVVGMRLNPLTNKYEPFNTMDE